MALQDTTPDELISLLAQRLWYILPQREVFATSASCSLFPSLLTHSLFNSTLHSYSSLLLFTPYRPNVHEILYNCLPATSKIAAFDGQTPSMERETWGYSVVDRHQNVHSGEPRIAPWVLGHLTECGRVMGILLERLEGGFASLEDLLECASTLCRLHEIGVVHGDANRYNLIVDKQSKKVKMVDFEWVAALEVDEAAAGLELESLASELSEETGRGAPRGLYRAAEVLVID
jgi:hypothetical protein